MAHDTGQASSIEVVIPPAISQADCIITSSLPAQILVHDTEEALQATDELILALSRLGIFILVPYAVALQDGLRVAHMALVAKTTETETSHVPSKEQAVS